VRDDAPVAQRPHTKEFTAEDRRRLGLAAIRAREAAGHPKRPSFRDASGVSVRSNVKLESGDPIGPYVYEAYARALPNWTEDTPVTILNGGPIPPPAKGEEKPRMVEGPELRDDIERQFWAITDLSEEERWIFIDLHRARTQRRNESAQGQTG